MLETTYNLNYKLFFLEEKKNYFQNLYVWGAPAEI